MAEGSGSLTQAIGHAHYYCVGEVADETAIVQWLGGCAGNKISPVDPHHHRHGGTEGRNEIHIQRDKYVQVEAVLTHL